MEKIVKIVGGILGILTVGGGLLLSIMGILPQLWAQYISGCTFQDSLWIFERLNVKLVRDGSQAVPSADNYHIQTIGLMHLDSGGRLSEYWHRNEKFWDLDNGQLVLLSDDKKRIVATFEQVTTLPGVVLRHAHLHGGRTQHQLRLQQPADCSKLY